MKASFAKFEKMQRIWLQVLAMQLALFVPKALASNKSLTDLRASIREDVRNIIQSADQEALVAVDVTPEIQPAIKLPGMNVTLDEMIMSDDSGTPKIKSVEITILSSLQALPPELESLIKKQVKLYTSSVRIKLQAKAPSNKPKPVEQKFPDIKLDIDPLNITMQTYAKFMVIALAVLTGMVGLLFFTMIDIARQNRRQIQAISTGAQQLAQALESGGPRANQQSALGISGKLGSQSSLGGAKSIDMINEMSDAGIAAIISDAYWCQQDGYAAYIWRRLPVARKQVLLTGLAYAKNYATYLSSIPESDEGWEQHPYYLNPLPIWNVSNEVVVQQIQQNPSLLSMLPPMRIAALPLDSSDILALKMTLPSANAPIPDLSLLPPSKQREMTEKVIIVSKNNEDDEKLLAYTDVPVEHMQQIISLAWITLLTESQIKDILKPMTAIDLASAWVGPQIVIDKLTSGIPDRKLKMVKSYLEKSRPSRTSASYEFLHRSIVDKIKQEKIRGPQGKVDKIDPDSGIANMDKEDENIGRAG